MFHQIKRGLAVLTLLLLGAFFSGGLAQQVGTTLTNAPGAPFGSCVSGSHYVDSDTGATWTCDKTGAWVRYGTIASGIATISNTTMPSLGCTNYIVGWTAKGALPEDTVVASFSVQPPDPDGFLNYNWFIATEKVYMRLCNPTGVSQAVVSTKIYWRVIR